MMRPFTCLSLIAALGAGLYLYQEKHKAAVLDRTINATVKQADQVRDHIGMLKLELAQLTDTSRLADLVAHHMPQLQPLMPVQYVRLDDLPSRLPAIGLPPAPPAAVDAPVADAEPAPPPEPPAVVAAAKPTVVQLAMRPAPIPAPAPTPAPTVVAKPHTLAPKPREPEYAYNPLPRPAYAPVMPAYAPTPVAVHAPTLQTASATAPVPYQSQMPFSGSSLGMARTTLPPPVPVGALSPR